MKSWISIAPIGARKPTGATSAPVPSPNVGGVPSPRFRLVAISPVCLANGGVFADVFDVKKPVNVNVTLDELIVEGLKIQPRFVAEPLFAKTGKGFMRSAGVEEIAAAKRREGNLPARHRLGKSW